MRLGFKYSPGLTLVARAFANDVQVGGNIATMTEFAAGKYKVDLGAVVAEDWEGEIRFFNSANDAFVVAFPHRATFVETIPGTSGGAGPQGPPGPQGNTGAQGPAGSSGSQGIQGPAGVTGNNGAAGSVWRNGAGAPGAGLGVNGDYYLDSTNGDVHLKASGSYSIIGNVKGTTGANGAQGIQGIQGLQGNQGIQGNTGLTGSQGPQGNPGNTGPAGPSTYAINVQALTSSPADGQTIFFGTLPKAPVTAAATSKIFIRRTGTIKVAEIYCFSGTAGTAEAWALSIRKNNTTDTLIASVAAATQERIFSNASLNIPVVAGDFIEIKAVNPTWATNPLTTIFGGFIVIDG